MSGAPAVAQPHTGPAWGDPDAVDATTPIGRHFRGLQPRWGTPECPYDTLLFAQMHEEFTTGGALALFCYIERAAANYVGAALRDAAYANVTVALASPRLARQFMRYLRDVLRNMQLDDAIVSSNGESLRLHGDRCVRTVAVNDLGSVRGIPADLLMVVGVELDASEGARCFRDAILPFAVVGGDVVHLMYEYDDDYRARVAAANLAPSEAKRPAYANIILHNLKHNWEEASAGMA